MSLTYRWRNRAVRDGQAYFAGCNGPLEVDISERHDLSTAHCNYCDRLMTIKQEEVGHRHYFCSVECACMAGHYSVRYGWLNYQGPPRKGLPKIPWWLPPEQEEEYIAKVTGRNRKSNWAKEGF